MVVLIPVVLVVGFVLGWLVRQRLNLHYKQLWLQATALLEDKTLLGDDRDQFTSYAASAIPVAQVQHSGSNSFNVQAGGDVHTVPYVHGKWALDERKEGNAIAFYAVRLGFDDVRLGERSQPWKLAALYRRDKENALAAIEEMNQK